MDGPKCGNLFVNRNQWHSCGRWPLSHHFAGRPRARALFAALRAAIEELGPVRVVSSKTRIAFMTRMRFAGCTSRADGLRGALLLVRPVRARCFERIVCYAPGYFGHEFRLRREEDLGSELRRHLREAYEIGGQRHVREPSWKRPRPGSVRPPPGPMTRAIVVWRNPRSTRSRRAAT